MTISPNSTMSSNPTLNCTLSQLPFCGSIHRIAIALIPCALYWLCMPWVPPVLPKDSFVAEEGSYNHQSTVAKHRWAFSRAPTISLISVACSLFCLLLSNVLQLFVDMKDLEFARFVQIFAICPVLATLVFDILHKLRAKANTSQRNSNACWLFLVANFCMAFPQFVSAIVCLAKQGDCYTVGSPAHVSSCLIFVFYYMLNLISTVIVSRAESPSAEYAINDRELPKWPEKWYSLPEKLYFTWFSQLIWKGFKRPVEMSDIFQVDESDAAENIDDYFTVCLNKEFGPTVKQTSLQRVEKGISTTAATKIDELLIEKKDFATTAEKPSCVAAIKNLTRPSTFRVLRKCFGRSIVLAGLLKFACDILHFAEPYFLQTMVAFCTDFSQPWWNGGVYVGMMCFVMLTRSHLMQQYFYAMNRIGVRVRTALMSAVYKKSLKLAPEVRKDMSTGEIVNLMSVDAGQFKESAQTIQMVWSAPLQIIVALVYMYYIVGRAVFAGVGILVTILLANILTCKLVEKLNTKQMKQKDCRMKLLSELLSAIKVIKLYAWEKAFQRRIEDVRQKELNCIKNSSYLSCVSYFSWGCAQFVVCLSMFAAYNGPLTPSVVFSTINLFAIIEFPLAMLPAVLSNIAMLRVSLCRFGKFFAAQEILPNTVAQDFLGKNGGGGNKSPPIQQNGVSKEHLKNQKIAINLDRASFLWQSDFEPVLSNLNLTIPSGHLVAVVGKVGSGKSSLLNALCGELLLMEGKWKLEGSVAYVSQQAWIQNLTVKDNITFGRPLNETLYNTILEACALQDDLKILPAGDMTEIGERGINLSGGQKQRISLARAAYQDADVYFLDDPLSAVDIHVGRHIFDKLLGPNGLLKTKTRILVTHNLCFSPVCDLIVVLNNGLVEETGNFGDLVEKDGAFYELVQQYFNEGLTDEEMDELRDSAADLSKFNVAGNQQRTVEKTASAHSLPNIASAKEAQKGKTREKTLSESAKNQQLVVQNATCEEEEEEEDGTLIAGENITFGRVSWSIYGKYVKACGPFLKLFVFLVFLTEVGSFSSHVWLQRWSDSVLVDLKQQQDNVSQPIYNNLTVNTSTNREKLNVQRGLTVFGLIGLVQVTCTVTVVFCFAKFQVRAGKIFHSTLVESILNAPMGFFDTTPLGRILNRCGKDIQAIDVLVPSMVDHVTYCLFITLASLGLVVYAMPYFIIALIPSGLVYYWLKQVYVSSSRQLRRLEAVTRSPVYCNFQETLNGLMTIRAFGRESAFVEKCQHLLDVNNSLQMCMIVANRWVGVRLDLVSIAGVATASIITVILRAYGITAGEAALAITFVIMCGDLYSWGVQEASAFETEIVAVERISEYCNMPSETGGKILSQSSAPLPQGWPGKGEIEFKNYSASHRPGLPLILKNLNFSISSGEKIGIVGRTGAGKSSLAMALFRLIETMGGKILIDNLDIDQMNLHELRKRLTIIPQEPALFSGTFRTNLDPFRLNSDDEIWQAVRLSGLEEIINSLSDEGLEYGILENGSNLSVGQRQLVCLARAILRKPKILVLDEATAAVDVETDACVQATIRDQFSGCTILTIAHRVNTVIDYDRVLVLDEGQVAELGTPSELLSNENGIFYKMVYDTNYSTSKSD